MITTKLFTSTGRTVVFRDAVQIGCFYRKTRRGIQATDNNGRLVGFYPTAAEAIAAIAAR